jgi:hypothetical protein
MAIRLVRRIMADAEQADPVIVEQVAVARDGRERGPAGRRPRRAEEAQENIAAGCGMKCIIRRTGRTLVKPGRRFAGLQVGLIVA